MNQVTYPEIYTAIGKLNLGRSSDALEDASGFNVMQVCNRQKEQVSRYAYPKGVLADEHLIVPKPDAPDRES